MSTSRFIQRFGDKITGVLSGYDRLVLRGSLLAIVFPEGMKRLLRLKDILLKEFGPWAQRMTEQLKEGCCQAARNQNRPIVYLQSASTDKEETARTIAVKDGITTGLVAILTCVEPCKSFEIYRNKQTHKLELVCRMRKGLVLYHYWIDPEFGWMNARIQSWLAFSIQVCINGREWLAQMLDKNGIGYRRHDNCFTSIDDVAKAQRFMNRQLRISWPKALERIQRQLNPLHGQMFRGLGLSYYWSIYQSEWATDVMFEKPSDLAAIYPAMVRHGMRRFSSEDVLRFLGRRVPVHGNFTGEVTSDFKDRTEGVRIKHRVKDNSIKAYDKGGSVLRIETTMNNPSDFKVLRKKHGDPKGKPRWRPLRRSVADVHRRAQVSQACNDRYLDALAATDTSTPLGELIRNISKPTTYRNKRVRALRPWADPDLALLRAIHRGEFSVNGFRNRDLHYLLFDQAADDDPRRRSARVSRLLHMLRAHHLIQKVPHTHRYVLTCGGREIITAVLTSHQITLQQLNKLAA